MLKEGQKALVTQTRSAIARPADFRRTLTSLGLGRIGKQREITLNKATIGAINTVKHIVRISIVK